MSRPGSRFLLVAILVASLAGTLAAHDLFLTLDRYFLPKHTAVRVPVLNGTFSRSESVLARDRIAALTLVGPDGVASLDTTAITARNDTSFVTLRTGNEGTYILGLSVRPRDVDYTGEQFTGYLKAEGYDDVLAERTRSGTLGQSGRRRYATHVKAIFQVGTTGSNGFATVLGYPAELVPLDNPYELRRGAMMRVRVMADGRHAPDLVVVAGGRGSRGAAIAPVLIRTDAEGIARVPLLTAGRWYVKFSRMRPTALEGLNYESQRATLTFEVR